MQPIVLRTARLELSIPVEADIDVITDACQDETLRRFTTVPSPYRREHAVEFVEKVAQWWDAGAEATWAFRRDGVLAGMIGLHRLNAGSGEIGYWTAAPLRGQGLLGEAARAVVDWGLSPDGLDLQRIEWRAVVGNTASARTARSVGFRFEGTLRGALVNGAGVRSDCWIAGLLPTDDRTPVAWPVL
ncbi:GNAT family N-acetyltransferase [Microbacterium luticocti]|uniref:GNAT family N-acetyltransferase n=1 Tax=Microbacterium luticocti TaxID=451764 RepID=UPI00040A18FB|nr:GNAT family N-acetyltransferase [Microbacterium luticocti]